MMNFPQNLSLLRRRAGYTQEGLAEAMNVSRQAVSKWESGQTLPEAAALPLLADLLGCTLDQLMREELAAEGPAPALQADGDRAVFEQYDRHMNRHAVLIASGVGLVMAGAGAMLSFTGMGVDSGLVLLPLLLFVGVAVALFVWAGLVHEDFQRQFPVVPDLYSPEERDAFRRNYRLGLAVSIGSLLLDVGFFLFLATLFDGREALEVWAVAILLLILAGSVSATVLLGMLEEKYHLDKYAGEAAKVRRKDCND